VPAADLLAELAGAERHADASADPDVDPDVAEDAPGGDGHSDGRADIDRSPVLVATGLGLHTRTGWVFRDVDLALRPGTVTAIVAPGGTGRSALLLALVGRMAVTDGTLAIAGRSAIADPRTARRRTSVARIADLIAPEERLTVAESVTERCLIDGVRTRAGRAAFASACSAMGITVDDSLLVEHLPAVQQTILALALATVRPADVIVLDDTDAGVDADGEREIYRAALALAGTALAGGAPAGTGPAIVTATTRRETLPDSVTVVDLTPRRAPGSPQGAPEPARDVADTEGSVTASGAAHADDSVTAPDVASAESPVTDTPTEAPEDDR